MNVPLRISFRNRWPVRKLVLRHEGKSHATHARHCSARRLLCGRAGRGPGRCIDRNNDNDSYKVTAQFLAYLVEKYDKEIVRKLNKTMREGEYKDEIWQSLTKKSLKGLGEEWKESLKPKSSTETGALDR